MFSSLITEQLCEPKSTTSDAQRPLYADRTNAQPSRLAKPCSEQTQPVGPVTGTKQQQRGIH